MRSLTRAYDQRICTGQFPLSDLLGLRHTIEGGFIIEEEEAKTVKYIFLATLCGYTAEEIAEVLTEKQRPTLRGRTEWTASMVKAIMENERRWGDLEVRKRVVIDYKEKVTAKNDGLREGAYIPHYHEGIVSPEIARAAHMMRASRYKFGSVPDVYVIDSGALKGFVSISPTWSGIDNRAFQDISRQVYNEDEFCELQRRANIMNGRTHSNVVSMTLNDYRVAPGVMFMTRSDPQLTFSQRSMKLNAVCWEKLGQQKYDTALQLAGFDPVMASIRHYDFADAAKDTPFYKEIIPATLDYFETEHYVFTHGWIPSIPNRDKSYSYISSWREADREQWNQARWFNGMDAAQTADENKTIVCGHWHTSYGHSKYEHKGTEFGEDADFSPYYGPGIIAIDACTAFSGKVNCLVIED